MKGKKLFRSSDERMIAGVCGGLSNFFEIDVTIIRLIWVLFVVFGGAGLLAYIIAAIIIPKGYES